MNKSANSRNLLLTGVAGPLTFAVSVIVGGELRAGYSHVDQFISELGESGSRFSWVMNYFGFWLSASLILIFVLTFRTYFPRNFLNAIGSIFLAMFAINVFLAGVFSCDVGCSPINASRQQLLHNLVSLIAFPAFVLGVLTWGISFYKRKEWRKFGVYSLVTVVVSTILLVSMVRSEAMRDGTGTYQRLFLTVLFLWLIALAIRLRKDTSTDETK